MSLLKFFSIIISIFLIIACGEPPKKDKISKQDPTIAAKKSTPKKGNEKPKESTGGVDSNESAKQNSEGATPAQLEKAKEIIASADKEKIEAVQSERLFKMHCATCHGFTGDMMVNGAKDLTKSKISLQEAVAQVYHGKGLMTPYKGILSNEELVAISQYTETLRK